LEEKALRLIKNELNFMTKAMMSKNELISTPGNKMPKNELHLTSKNVKMETLQAKVMNTICRKQKFSMPNLTRHRSAGLGSNPTSGQMDMPKGIYVCLACPV